MMSFNSPPQTEDELQQRCQQLAGKTLGLIAAELGLDVPANLKRHKGWVGQLLERYLGADAGNLAEPDFTRLGIEMKTLPLNNKGEPKESTYVCTVALNETGRLTWQQSWVRQKLSKVLWVPIEADSDIALADRYIGQAWIWQPTQEQEQVLQQDWNELMDRIVLGEQAEITAKEGQYLQIRPKAAHSRIMAHSTAEDGSISVINPKGFYLRTTFTRELLAAAYI